IQVLDLQDAELKMLHQHLHAHLDEEPVPASAGYAARIAHSAVSSLPSAALLLYCSAISWPFSNRRATSDRISVSGTQSTACSHNGAPVLTSSQRASPTTTKPMIRMTKTAGPSPASAKR